MGFERKFKDGDKVKVIKTNDPKYNQIGKIEYYQSSYNNSKGMYGVSFENGFSHYYPNNLEKVEDSSNTNTKSNKLSISDLKPGMKVRIRPDLKEGSSKLVYVTYAMADLTGTIQTIEYIKVNKIYLKNQTWVWSIDCFSEIIEESKEEINISENIKLPLKEGQIVTLLDGEKYQVIKNNTNKYACYFCSLYNINEAHKCSISHINNAKTCPDVIPHNHYFKWCQDQKIEDNSSKSLTVSDFKIGMKIKVKKDFDKIIPTSTLDLFHFYHIPIRMKLFEEKELIVENIGNCFITAKSLKWYPEWLEIIKEPQIFCENESSLTKVSEETGIITKVTFTLNEFKSEKLEHSKFTIL